jgi:hypothetical protein
MSHGPEHHIEHAEHAQHAARDPFDKRVTVSIAIVAAVLAAVTMMGHRAHNETLRLQINAGAANTETANAWAFYQAKKNRGALYGAFLDFSAMLNLKEGTEASPKKAVTYWKNQKKKYDEELPGMEKDARAKVAQTKELQKAAEAAHHKGDRLDIGELGLQLGVVLCSLAILTKGRAFWFAGIACSAVGLIVALTGVFGLFMGNGHH